MRYLSLLRPRLILACFALTTLILIELPAIDIAVSRFFFHGGRFSDHWLPALMHEAMGWFLGISIGTILAVYGWNRRTQRNTWGIDGARALYIVLVLAIGGGLIVNVVLKDNFGRARPRDVAEFGGEKTYTAPFVMANQCRKNCSFSSGEGASGFFAFALALALSRRRSAIAAAAAFGTFVSLCRIASGAHFFSDVVVSFFVMLIVADVLYFYLVASPYPGLRRSRVSGELLGGSVATAASSASHR